MLDLYGSLGSAQSSKCAGSAVFPANYMSGGAAPAPLKGDWDWDLPTSTKVELGVKTLLVLGAIVGVGYLLLRGAGTLAANPKQRYTYQVRIYNERRDAGELRISEAPASWVWAFYRSAGLQVSPSDVEAKKIGVPAEVLQALPGAIQSAPVNVWTQVGTKGSYRDEVRAEQEKFLRDFEARHAADLPRWEREERETERRYAAGIRREERATRTRKSNDSYSPFEEHLRGGRASGMRPEDFDPVELARGTKHELEHTWDREIATEIAMDHLAEDEAYYEKLDAMERGSFRDNPKLQWQPEGWARLAPGQFYRLRQRAKGEWLVVLDTPNGESVVGAERTPALAKKLAQEHANRRDNPFKADCVKDCHATFGKNNKPKYLKKCLAACHGVLLGKGLADLPSDNPSCGCST